MQPISTEITEEEVFMAHREELQNPQFERSLSTALGARFDARFD
jgi:hypothetical protein